MPRWYKQIAAWNKKHGEAVQFLMFPCDEFKQELPSEEIVSSVALLEEGIEPSSFRVKDRP